MHIYQLSSLSYTGQESRRNPTGCLWLKVSQSKVAVSFEDSTGHVFTVKLIHMDVARTWFLDHCWTEGLSSSLSGDLPCS